MLVQGRPAGQPTGRVERIRTWRQSGTVLLVLWAIIAAGVWSLDRGKPSAQKTVLFLQQHPVNAGLSAQERQSWITHLAAQINKLESEDRQRVFLDPRMRQSLALLTDQEKSLYLQLTLAKGIPEMLEGFRQAPPDRRFRWLDVALNELEQLQGGSRRDFEKILDRNAIARIAYEGLDPYLRDAGVTVQIQLQPLLERIQNIVQVTR